MVIGLATVGTPHSACFQLSFHIFKQQGLVTLTPDIWATPANGKHTPVHCTLLLFVAHRTWPLRWLQITLVTSSVFKVHSPFYTCKPEIWAGKLSRRMSANKATHTLNTNFITPLKSCKEIAHVPFCFLCTKIAEEVPWGLKKGVLSGLKKKCFQACIEKYLQALHRKISRPAEHFQCSSIWGRSYYWELGITGFI